MGTTPIAGLVGLGLLGIATSFVGSDVLRAQEPDHPRCPLDVNVVATYGNHDVVTALATTRESVWVGTGGGLIWLDADGTERARITALDGLSASHVTAIEARSDDAVLVGTTSGVDYFDGTAWHNLIEGALHPDEAIRSLGTVQLEANRG